MTTRVGLYLRISEDRDGTQTATERQRADCERYAAAQGWEIADTFEDVDLSAFQTRVKRPQFERMVAALQAGHIDGVLGWKLDRLARRQRDLVRLDEACEASKAFIVTLADSVDTRTAAGRFVAELLTSMARMESENISLRGRRKAQELAEKGRPHVGGSRLFGYSLDRLFIVDEEADLLREAAQRLIDGESLRALCFDFQRRGIKTSTGRDWRQNVLKKCLTSAAMAGLREHRGVLSEGSWPAILQREEWERLRQVLRNPARSNGGTAARSYLLSGMVRCGRCSQPLVSRRQQDGGRRYVCSRQPGHPLRCGSLSRNAERVEEIVKEAAIDALDGVDLRAYFNNASADTAGLHETIRRDERALEQLATDFYAEQRISRAEFFAARDAVNSRLERSRAELGRVSGKGFLGALVGAGATIRQEWDRRDFHWRRTLLNAIIDHVDVLPGGRGRFDPSLIAISYKF